MQALLHFLPLLCTGRSKLGIQSFLQSPRTSVLRSSCDGFLSVLESKVSLLKLLYNLLSLELKRKPRWNNCPSVTTWCCSSWKAICLQPFCETLSFHLLHLLMPLAAPDIFSSRKLRTPKKLDFVMFHFFCQVGYFLFCYLHWIPASLWYDNLHFPLLR